MKSVVLLLSNNDLEREKLFNTLNGVYVIKLPDNDGDAIASINDGSISAVIIDADNTDYGIETLRKIHKSCLAENIPVLLVVPSLDAATQAEVLSLYQVAFVIKPYNDNIIKNVLHNSIVLNENGLYKGILRYDKLTGIYTREAFFIAALKMIKRHQAGYYVMACFDIDHFRIINDQYGMENGDKTLKYVADCIKNVPIK